MTTNIVNECIKRPWTGTTMRFLALAFVLATVLMLQSSTALAITTERVSVDSGGAQATGGPSMSSAISGDGRYVAFESFASNLVGADTNGASDIFVRDRVGLATTRVSEKSGGGQATGGSNAPAITPDGRYVVFHSFATNLTTPDGNGAPDVFLHDRNTNTTELVSMKLGGGDVGNGGSLMAAVSDDGRYVVYQSTASNLVASDINGLQDIFVRDRVMGTTALVSLTSLGAQATGGSSSSPAISNDGTVVAFESSATNLVTPDTNGAAPDVFVRELGPGLTSRVSKDSGGIQGNSASGVPSIDFSGRLVTFQSNATNLVAGDTNAATDIFLHNRVDGSTRRVSVDSSGAQAVGGPSFNSTINGGGKFVTFDSNATNLVAGDTNGFSDVFVRDVTASVTMRVSVDSGGLQGNQTSISPDISDDGIWVSFSSKASNLVPLDTNALDDVFVQDRDDFDSDGIVDGLDNCPFNYNPAQADVDLDGIGDACDTEGPLGNTNGLAGGDDCLDGVDNNGNSLTDAAEFLCTDTDGDGVPDVYDNCPSVSNPGQANSDLDFPGDACDNCPSVTNYDQYDFDNDGIGNACDTEGPLGNTNGQGGVDDCLDVKDNDGDGFTDAPGEVSCIDSDGDGDPDVSDNCPTVPNPSQTNSDGDSYGDACDNCPSVTNPDQYDFDNDGIGNVCDTEGPLGNTNGQFGGDDCLDFKDNDGDGFLDAPGETTCIDTDGDGDPDVNDNCPTVPNPAQTDTDGDGKGDACDNCPSVSNAAQTDSDSDGLGNACDNCPNTSNPLQENADGDPFGDVCDNCPTFSTVWSVPTGDTDCDGFPDTVTAGTRGRENFIGTDMTDRCADTTIFNDETADSPWPPDFNDNRKSDLSDIVAIGGGFNQNGPNPPNPLYKARFDMNASNSVNLSDLVAMGPFFNKNCTP